MIIRSACGTRLIGVKVGCVVDCMARAVCYSPDGNYIAVGCGGDVDGKDNEVLLVVLKYYKTRTWLLQLKGAIPDSGFQVLNIHLMEKY